MLKSHPSLRMNTVNNCTRAEWRVNWHTTCNMTMTAGSKLSRSKWLSCYLDQGRQQIVTEPHLLNSSWWTSKYNFFYPGTASTVLSHDCVSCHAPGSPLHQYVVRQWIWRSPASTFLPLYSFEQCSFTPGYNLLGYFHTWMWLKSNVEHCEMLLCYDKV